MTVQPSELPIAKRSQALLNSLGAPQGSWAPSALLLWLLTEEADLPSTIGPQAQQREFVEETLLPASPESQAAFLLDEEDLDVDPGSDPDNLRTLLLDLLHGAMLEKVPDYRPEPLLP